MNSSISIRAADYFWAIAMEYEAAIAEVMLYTMTDYQTAKSLMSALTQQGYPMQTAQAIIIEHVNRGLDWRTIV